MLTLFLNYAGTHDIADVTLARINGSIEIEITTAYSEFSTAWGALFSFVFVQDRTNVDLKRSVFVILNGSSTQNYTLPFEGEYRVFVYDIEANGTLNSGLNYPAVTENISSGTCTQGFFMKLGGGVEGGVGDLPIEDMQQLDFLEF